MFQDYQRRNKAKTSFSVAQAKHRPTYSVELSGKYEIYEKFGISIETCTAMKKMRRGLKQQDGQVQSRSFNSVTKAYRVYLSLLLCTTSPLAFKFFVSWFYFTPEMYKRNRMTPHIMLPW